MAVPEKINGTDAIIKMNLNGSMAAYCYAKNFEVNFPVELVGVSTMGDGTAKRFKSKRWTWTVSMDALVLLADDLPKSTTPQMLEAALQFVEVPIELFYVGEFGTPFSISGRVWIQNMTISATPSGFVSKNVSMQGTGGVIRSDQPVGLIDLTMEVVASPGAVSMSNIKIVDGIGNETVVHAGTIANGTNVVATIPAGTYHIRATLDSDRPYNLFYSDAAPTFSEAIAGPVSGLVHFPYPPDYPIWDFTVNRYLRWQGSDTPLA